MTIAQVIALPAGRELDQAVHAIALGRPGRSPAYSTKPDAAIDLVSQLPIGVARISQHEDGFNAERPYVAFTLSRHKQLLTWWTPITVSAATPALALSKMALIYSLSGKEAPRAPGSAIPKLGTFIPRPPREALPDRPMTARLPDIPGAPKLTGQ